MEYNSYSQPRLERKWPHPDQHQHPVVSWKKYEVKGLNQIRVVLPDEALIQQVCSECYQYLSVLPVAVNRKGEKCCGRCYSKYFKHSSSNIREKRHSYTYTHESNYTTQSYYTIISQNMLFKCVNHFEGCKTILSVYDTVSHEKKCPNKKQNCFFCSFYGNLCQIIFHCAYIHADNFTWDGSFELNLSSYNNEKSYIFVKESSIFLIVAEVLDQTLSIVISTIGKQKLVAKQYAIRFWVPSKPDTLKLAFIDYGLFNMHYETCFKKQLNELEYHFGNSTNILQCQVLLSETEVSEKEIEVDKRYQNLRIRESNIIERERELKIEKVQLEAKKTDLQTMVENERLEINTEKQSLHSLKKLLKTLSYDFFRCVSCQNITTTSPVYFCTKQHCYCSKCLTNNCVKCNAISEFNELTSFQTILVNCDWPQCTDNITFDTFISHKRDCNKRPYKCPLKDCGLTVYSSFTFSMHWHCNMPALIISDTIEYSTYDKYEFYWHLRKDVYHVLIEFLKDKTEILIEEVNVLPNNNTFRLSGHCSGYNVWNDEVDFTNFCGKFKFVRNKSDDGYDYNKIKIICHDTIRN